MLVELDVRDFAVVEHVTLRLSPGFNVLTGETGAGKSILVDALGQLIGERSDSSLVRTGCDRAVVQGVFEPGPARALITPVLRTYGLDDGPQIVVAKEITAAGRSTARINGSIVTVRVLGEIGRTLVDVHGQSDNVSLKRPSEHIELLDRYAGLGAERRAMADVVGRLRAVESEIDELRRDEEELQRRADLLEYQVSEVRDADISAEEEAELLSERTRLANAEKLAQLADSAYSAMRDEEGDAAAAIDLLDRAVAALDGLVGIDESLADVRSSVAAACDSLSETATRLRAYRDGLSYDAVRWEEVEDRLSVYADLKRKYGGQVSSVMEFADAAATDLARITGSAERLEQLGLERDSLRAEAAEVATALSVGRSDAADRLAEAVMAELEGLGMEGSRFSTGIAHRPDHDGIAVQGGVFAYDEKGVDDVAFNVSLNPGEDLRPLVKVSSGGETARLMLALKSILTSADRVPSLVFDEIDAGIGGRVGSVVGRKLWGVAGRHQVLCVTHLPQVAAYGDTHHFVSKRVEGGRTVTDVSIISGDDRVAELSSMLGSLSTASLDNAAQLLDGAGSWKKSASRDEVVAEQTE